VTNRSSALDGKDPQDRGPAPVTSVTLLTQSNCELCQHARDVLSRVRQDHHLIVTEIELATPDGRALAVQHGVLFAPGVLLNGKPFSHGRLSEKKLRAALTRKPG
jgi:glutaredoxin